MREFSGKRVYEFEDFRLDVDHLLLFRDGRQLALRPKAVETLLVLVERDGEVVSKDELMQILWPDTVVEESNLSQNLYILRKVLGSTSAGGPFIETLRRRGYRFNGKAHLRDQQIAAPDAPRSLNIERLDNIYSVAEWRRENQAGGVQDRTGRQRWVLPLAIAVFVVVLGGLAFGIYKFAAGGRSGKAGEAVIPFRGRDVVRLTTRGRTKHAAISPDGRYVAHVTEDADGSNLWVRQVTGTADVRIAGPSASEYVWTAFAPDGNSVYYLSLERDKGDTELMRVPTLGGPAVRAAYDTGPVGFSPDGASIVFIRTYQEGESRLIVAATDGSNEQTIASRHRPEYFRLNWNAPAWSPDGKTIACPVRLADDLGQYDTILGINAGDGAQRPLTNQRWQQAGQPQWLADGLMLTAAERTTDPQQVWHIAADGAATRVTHDLDDYSGISLTTDGTGLAAVQNHVLSSFWVTRQGISKQIASEVGGLDDFVSMQDSRIAYFSNASGGTDIWTMDGDGTNPRQVTAGALASRGIALSPDGNQFVFSSERSGRPNIWRVNVDGTNLKQLTNGEGEFYPQCTPDGLWIIFQNGEVQPTLWKIPIAGGEAIQLSEAIALRPAISPDGSMAAFHYLDSQFDRSRWEIGVMPISGGPLLKRFDLSPTVKERFVQWSPDGRSIAFANAPNGGTDIWLQPLAGGPPHRLTDFKAEKILSFNWSSNGPTLAVIRAVETSDVIIIGNASPPDRDHN